MWALLGVVVVLLVGAPGSAEPPCISQFPALADVMIAQFDEGRASWGVLIEPVQPVTVSGWTERELFNGSVFYAHNADVRFVPASNTKLLTSAAYLSLLGP